MNDSNRKQDYLNELVKEPFTLLEFLRESENVRNDICPSVGKEAGQLLYFLSKLIKSKKILEIGTSIGYSTIWLSLAAKENNGHLDTIEIAERLSKEALKNLTNLKLDSYVTFHQGLAENLIENIDKDYDLIFIDSSTKSYENLYEKALKKLKQGGLMIFEDVLFPSMDKRESQKELMYSFNRKIKNDKRITNCYLNIGDGILLCLKK